MYNGPVSYIILSSMQLYGLTNLERIYEPIVKGTGSQFRIYFKITVPELELIGAHETGILRNSYHGTLAVGFPANEVLMSGTLNLKLRKCLQLDRIELIGKYSPIIYVNGFGLFNRYAASKVTDIFHNSQQQLVEVASKKFRKNSEAMLNELDCGKLGFMIV
ncbi:uncharacterized protein LOC135160800 [Diachasmimorpha longicaudata]|uniref:uncharacterized protein LOC135160800 n=1 Tax=Diachasmimorpha longicaudata TaxID=58733 RepID=UPI0030B90D8F